MRKTVEARMHKRMIPGCVEGKQATAPCACGTMLAAHWCGGNGATTPS
jgi:hypothetical protein